MKDYMFKSTLFQGSMFIGLGLGFMCDQIPGGVILGMGIGLILSYVFKSSDKE